MRFFKEIKMFCWSFARACAAYPVRSALLILYFILYYFFQTLFLLTKEYYINAFMFGCAALFYLIESSIRLIITIPIRNEAVKIARTDYVNSNLKIALKEHDRTNFGPIYAAFKRIENIFTGLERDISGVIKYLPLFILSSVKVISISKNKLIPFALITLNLCSIMYVKFWHKLRKSAFIADENMNKKILMLFQNIDRSEISQNLNSFANKTIQTEVNLYVKSLLTKQYYKLLLCAPNILFIFFLARMQIYNQKEIITIILLVFNWIQFSLSTISIVGLLSGIRAKNAAKSGDTVYKSPDILVSKLTIEGLFDDLNFSIKQGERVVITGQNGVGKTFLLRLISGQIKNTHVKAPSRYALISNNSSIFEEEKPLLGANEFWQKHLASKYSNLLQEKFLSTGQNLFLSICLVLVYEPDLILMDEALDFLSHDMLESALFLLNSLDSTLVVVSHREDIIGKFPRNLRIEDMKIKAA